MAADLICSVLVKIAGIGEGETDIPESGAAEQLG